MPELKFLIKEKKVVKKKKSSESKYKILFILFVCKTNFRNK